MIYYCRIYQDDDCFSVRFPDVPGALTYGKSVDQALRMAKDALNLVLASLVEDGEPLPKSKSHGRKNYYAIEVEPTIVAAARIRDARRAAGLTQKQMASRLNVAYQVYQKLEDPQKSNPTIKTLARVAGALGNTLEISI